MNCIIRATNEIITTRTTTIIIIIFLICMYIYVYVNNTYYNTSNVIKYIL